MVVIDTDVFLLEFAFHRDTRYPANSQFLAVVRDHSPAITVYNLMEILGQLSFNLAPARLAQWRIWLQAGYNLTMLWPEPGELDAFTFFRQEIHEAPLARMQENRLSFLDALVLNLAEQGQEVTAFVTWNAKHFKDKSHLTVLTPSEYLSQPW